MGRGRIVLQIHKNSSNPLAPILGVELIKEVIKVRFVFLPHFIVENLKSLSMVCTSYSYHEKCSRLFSNIFRLNYSFPSSLKKKREHKANNLPKLNDNRTCDRDIPILKNV